MTMPSWVPRINIQIPIEVIPVVSTSPAYTAGDQVGGVMTLPNVVRSDTALGFGTASLAEVTILDKAKQSAAFEIWFFKNNPTIASSDNAAFDLTDANLFASAIGYVSVGSSYSTSTSNSVSSAANLNKRLYVDTNSTTLYAVAKTTGTPTYASTGDLKFIFIFDVD